MILAVHNNVKMRAKDAGSGALGRCPWTNYPVKAKVGELRQYWAYDGDKPNLPIGYEPESEWHAGWKQFVLDEFCEVVCGENNEHRADVLGMNNTIIEIQKSPLDIRVARERVEFYSQHSQRRVVWVVDASDYWKKRLFVDFKQKRDDGFLNIEWKYERAWVVELAANLNTTLYLDYNHEYDKLLHMWLHKGKLVGRFITKFQFFEKYYLANAREEYKISSELLNRQWITRNNN